MDGPAWKRRAMTIPCSGKSVVLYVEGDSGWGGSARSLFNLLQALDRSRVEPVVFVRRDGPIVGKYAEIGIRCVVAPELTSYRPSERKNWLSFLIYCWRRRHLGRLVRRVEAETHGRRIRLIHVNHESLAAIGSSLAERLGVPWVAHCRVQLFPGWFAHRLYRRIVRSAAGIICITRPVREHIERVLRHPLPASKTAIVNNIVTVPAAAPAPLDILQSPPDRFRVLSLSNFSPNRGVDRIIDVATALTRQGRTDFAFYLCGRPANRSALTGRVSPYYEQIVKRVTSLALEETIFFPGYVSDPERALASCDALIKLTRQSNPWGRDIMEALGAGLPVVTLGDFQGFVENGVNGFVDGEFDPGVVAGHLIALADDPRRRKAMATANRIKARRLFDGPARARDVEAIYEKIIGKGDTEDAPASTAA